jgi:hypothetical protein
MSEKFTLLLSGIIRYSFIDRILRGELGVRWEYTRNLRKDLMKEREEINEILEMIRRLDEDERCIEARLRILGKYGPERYMSIMVKTKLSCTQEEIEPTNCNSFIRDYVKNNFKLELEVA